jgi:hypothetical protein
LFIIIKIEISASLLCYHSSTNPNVVVNASYQERGEDTYKIGIFFAYILYYIQPLHPEIRGSINHPYLENTLKSK